MPPVIENFALPPAVTDTNVGDNTSTGGATTFKVASTVESALSLTVIVIAPGCTVTGTVTLKVPPLVKTVFVESTRDASPADIV